MPSSTYLPRTDAKLRNFVLNMSAQLAKGPELVGVSEADAQQFDTLATAYATAYDQSQAQETRGPSATAKKNDCRGAVVAMVRRLVPKIQSFIGTTNQQRTDFLLTIRDTHYTPQPVPTTAPTLTVTGVLGNTISVALQDADDLHRRAKPAHVKSATLFWALGDTPPNDPSGWTFEGTTTTTTTQIVIPPHVAGATSVWLTAFWANSN
ncbi:MAG: hypothetical protein AAF797_13275, partial [Planctomycetota bacterium]